MFVAWRDLRFAKGRFTLITAVIVLITLLVGLLSGLTEGLGRQNTSAITDLPVDHLAFSEPADGEDISFTESSLSADVWQQWAEEPGVENAEPLGIHTTRAEAGDHTASVSAFGVEAGSPMARDVGDVDSGSVVMSAEAADELDVTSGQEITVEEQTLTVETVGDEASYSHTPVMWTSFTDFQQLAPSSDTDAHATVVGLTTAEEFDPATADERVGTQTVALDDSLSALSSYDAENGSLQLMRAFLFAIAALVIGAFFTVWTIQRSADIAVLKALGASTGYLLRDALGQAVVLLVSGTAIGTALAVSLGALLGDAVPFVLDPMTVLVPAVVMIVLGAAGALLSIRRITAVDPLTALGSGR